jgi:predicted ribonuclease YlaK
MLDKVLSSQAGNILKSKLGGEQAVEDLLNKEQLVIVPAADARGYEVPANSGVYIMESQNLDTTLLRLLLQRIGKDSKVIVDGDRLEQTDLYIYKEDNGMKKMSEVFRGEEVFGQVDLKNIYRSEIAEIAEKMK